MLRRRRPSITDGLAVQTYISLITYTDAGLEGIKESPRRLELARTYLRDLGGEMKQFYLTLGRYDLITAFEVPDDQAAAKFLLAIGRQRRVRTETLKAFSELEYRAIIDGLPDPA